jgi:hypothetical protein
MAAPTPTAPVASTAHALGDGHSTRIVFGAHPTLPFEEVEVTPPGFDGGAMMDMANMHNVTYRTFAFGKLVTVTEAKVVVNYDTDILASIPGMINKPDTITFWYPDNSHDAIYGGLLKWEPSSLKANDKPTATMTIGFTMRDPTTCQESTITHAAATGTADVC